MIYYNSCLLLKLILEPVFRQRLGLSVGTGKVKVHFGGLYSCYMSKKHLHVNDLHLQF